MRNALILLAIGMGLVLILGSAKNDCKLQGVEPECWRVEYSQKITDYQIISAADLNTLQGKVKEQLKYGLRPMGDISYFDPDYLQVMVK